MMIRVAINGYGRIGRVAHRVILEKHSSEIEVVAINAGSSTDIKGWMYLLKYDTSYGPIINHEIKSEIRNPKSETNPNDQNTNVQNRDDYIGSLIIDDKKIPVFSQKDPSLLPWKDLNVDVVIESTGHFLTEEKLKAHLSAGAKKVVLSAPAKGGEIATYVLSVNDKNYKGESLINNASCTTNCIVPVARIMVDHFGVEKAMMTTIHGYTSDQRLQDGGHKDYRRARAAGQNIIPTSTGATIAASEAIPELKGIFNGLAVRVPVAVGSLSDFTFLLKKETTKEEINDVFKKEAENPQYKNVLEVTEDPIVSSDIIGNAHSSVVDLSLTQVVGGNMVKVIAWYDNEYGYANRLVEEVLMVGNWMTVDGRK
ncbi:MAG: type I glyceraldehyde-3-phosphate dehydrogenase [Candidatus Levybacteria bacterium RIFCSPHIGHO2_02_FULL_37_13]|nr:MAG: type I glyceraldehyde-3-phosphate dehydrogenase [Candidatus Levybacteria bacterium RIFCSPHIGHO2_02_FULL_37_13]OGH30629.1 MAG: type I glyceraldehyde-3-phosphate dehydrogenase [Candidatus Levybacteria bacterium RIFCSPHIGHO2_12_FULL_37_9]OGH37395.1 MAG: type I glyceraldehyde-3-phosphate dehydrogenase [Candidatus Levybacteria bacterium RIFCSPLOWO2_01_FULL_37_26]